MKIQNIVSMTVMLAILAVPVVVFAQPSASGFQGVDTISGIAGGEDLAGVISTIINIFLGLAGLIAAIYLILGGVSYITSRGDSDKAEDAKNTILFAIIGLIVIGLSAVITNFVISIFRNAG